MNNGAPEVPSQPIRIVHLGEGDGGVAWDAYVGPRTGTVTDLFAWRRVVRGAYGLRSDFLVATAGSHVVGTLGLFEIKHPIFGHYLTTAIFGNDGGLHFDSQFVRDALIAEARRITAERRASYLVIRTRHLELEGASVDRGYRSAVVDLAGGADHLWNALPGKTRNQVRRGMKEGFTVETGHGQLGAFYDVFHHHMRDLGSPAHSRAYYESIVEQLGDRCDFLVVRDGKTLVGGALLFWTNGTAMNYHTVSLRAFNRRCPNYLLYWTMLQASCTRGCRWFDLGRSRSDSTNLEFKENWNPAEVTLHYNYFLRRQREIPNLDPRNARYRLQIGLWRKMPLMVTKVLGPRLITGLA